MKKESVTQSEYLVYLNNEVCLVYREWTDSSNGLVLNYSLFDINGANVDDDFLIDLVQQEIEKEIGS